MEIKIIMISKEETLKKKGKTDKSKKCQVMKQNGFIDMKQNGGSRSP